MAIEEVANAWTSSIKKTVGYAESPAYFIYKNGWVRIYSYEKVHQKIADYTLNKIEKDKLFVPKVKAAFNQRAEKLLAFIDKIKKIKWPEIRDSRIVEIKEEYIRLYDSLVPYGEPLPYFLKERIQIVLENYLVNEKKIPKKEYEILLTPLYQSFLNREQEELLKIYKRHGKNSRQLNRQLENHKAKYSWILFDYASIAVDKNFFRKRLSDLIKNQPVHLNYRKLKKQKKSIIEKYKINNRYLHYLNVLEDLFYLMDKKKEILSRAHFAITPLFGEAGRRLGLDLKIIRWHFWKEIKETLLNKRKLDKKIAASRKRFSVVEFRDGRGTALSKAKSLKLISLIKQDEKLDKKIKLISGIAASPGKVKGIIRYLKSAKENHKIKKGEILLVSNTTPDFMPAIRLAKAIITNEGGITCHAAIVSREFKIPCIVGTEIATKVLKDGDLVEVDAERGVVKILKRK